MFAPAGYTSLREFEGFANEHGLKLQDLPSAIWSVDQVFVSNADALVFKVPKEVLCFQDGQFPFLRTENWSLCFDKVRAASEGSLNGDLVAGVFILLSQTNFPLHATFLNDLLGFEGWPLIIKEGCTEDLREKIVEVAEAQAGPVFESLQEAEAGFLALINGSNLNSSERDQFGVKHFNGRGRGGLSGRDYARQLYQENRPCDAPKPGPRPGSKNKQTE